MPVTTYTRLDMVTYIWSNFKFCVLKHYIIIARSIYMRSVNMIYSGSIKQCLHVLIV